MTREKTFFDRLLGSIERVRNPGDPPRESIHSFDEFECDLCKGFNGRTEIIQCHYCGRWVCKGACWNQETLSCLSCSSVIKLGKEFALNTDTDDKGNREEDPEGKDGDGILQTIGGKVKNNIPGLGER